MIIMWTENVTNIKNIQIHMEWSNIMNNGVVENHTLVMWHVMRYIVTLQHILTDDEPCHTPTFSLTISFLALRCPPLSV